MGFPLVHDDVLLRGRNPRLGGKGREIHSKGVLVGLWAPFLAQRPAIDFITTGHDAIVAGRCQDFGILGGKDNFVFGNVILGRHSLSPLAFKVIETAE